MLTGPGRYERAQPVFDRARRTFHRIVSVEAVTAQADAAILRLATDDGADLEARLTFPEPTVVRIQRGIGARPEHHRTEMLVRDPPALPVTVEDDGETIVVHAGGPAVTIRRQPWQLRFGDFATEPNDGSLIEWVAEPSGYALESGRAMAYETFSLRAGEELFGLGERFHGPALRGHRLAHWIDEPFGTNTTDLVYKSVPLVISSHRYGVFAHHPEEATFDLGCGSNASATILVHTGDLDLFVMLGTPKEVLRSYTSLTGRPPVLPEWTYGIWMLRCMYESRAEVLDVLDTAAELGIPIDVIGIDPLWLANRPGKEFDTCDFVWNERDFGPLEDLTALLHERGVRLCLWVNTHVADGTEAWAAERMAGRGTARDRLFPERGYVDLTGAGADWWVEEMTRLLTAGVDAFKLDYSETLPADTVMADGRHGSEVHNLYPLLASLTAARAGAAVHFTRAGTAGSQRLPIHWAGDSQSTWAGMHGALRGGLAAAWSGFAHWTTDVGGFFRRELHDVDAEDDGFRQVDAELYIRWMQMAMFLSHTRFHGMAPREPWHFGDDAVAIARQLAGLRLQLRPYLLRAAAEANATGCPLLRPVALEFPDDPGARHVDTEFLLGADLVVCPVLQSGGGVDVYVPPGEWTDHFTGERFSGPGWVRTDVPLERFPLLVRDGTSPFD